MSFSLATGLRRKKAWDLMGTATMISDMIAGCALEGEGVNSYYSEAGWKRRTTNRARWQTNLDLRPSDRLSRQHRLKIAALPFTKTDNKVHYSFAKA
jgi:hypothetical protein